MSRWHPHSGYGTALGLPPRPPESTRITGHCASGSHEGRPKKTSSGQRLKECVYREHCACDCHASEEQLRQLMGQVPEPAVIPGAPIAALMGTAVDISGTPWLDHVAAGATVEQTNGSAVENGLRNRLEWRMYEVCEKFVDFGAHQSGIMTVAFFQQQLPGTSSGAIDSVLKRWTEQGFATMEKKPTRFTGYTERGAELGLEKYLYLVKKGK